MVDDPPYYWKGKKEEEYTKKELEQLHQWVITRTLFFHDLKDDTNGMEEEELFYLSNAVCDELGIPLMAFDKNEPYPGYKKKKRKQ